MSQALNLKISGLYSHPNNLSSVPEGALSAANNIVIDNENEAQPRRGFDRLDYALPNISDRAQNLFQYQNKLLAQYGSKIAYYDAGLGWVNYSGSFSPADTSTNRIRGMEANSNLYLTTSEGIKVLDKYDGTIFQAGMPKGLNSSAVLSGHVSGFMQPNTQVAYRVVWGYKDANNNLVLGAPSQRVVISNATVASDDVTLTVTIPGGITVDDFFQVYRSAQSAGSSIEPNDELQLVYEANPTATDISNKSVTFTDQTPDDLRAATLYTSPSQEGIANANDEPPFAKDIAVFKGSMFFANTKSKHRINFAVLSVGGTNGISIGDVITIAGVNYTARAVENIAANEFKVVTAGTPSQNITDTTLSLIKVINSSASNSAVYAYYLSGYTDLPGKVMIEERGLGGSGFNVSVSGHSTAYNPQIPTSLPGLASSNDEYKNGVFISKLQQPEAVPLTSYVFAGSAAKPILRAIPLRDSLFLLKEDGIYRITGEERSSFRVDQIDNTTKLLAPDSAVVLNNTIFALTDQGVVSISDTGVQIMSRQIENTLTELFGKNLQVLKEVSFGVSYESERKYILFTISNSADTFPTQAFVFNTFTNSWVRWTLDARCGLVKSDEDKLYLGKATAHHVLQERKTYSFRDHADEGDTVTLIAQDDKVLTLSGDLTPYAPGDLVWQNSSLYAVIQSIELDTNQVTIVEEVDFTVGSSVTIYEAIDSLIEWVPQTGGNPGITKHYRELSFMFRVLFNGQCKIGFYSDASGGVEDVMLDGTSSALWGLFQWGNAAWGGIQRPKPIRTLVPLEKSRCSQLSIRFSHSQAYSSYRLDGVSVLFDRTSERITK